MMYIDALVALNMLEFFTEWSENDPKWIAVFIIVGGWISWKGYKDYKKEEKPFKLTVHNALNIGRDVSGLLILLIGLIKLIQGIFFN